MNEIFIGRNREVFETEDASINSDPVSSFYVEMLVRIRVPQILCVRSREIPTLTFCQGIQFVTPVFFSFHTYKLNKF
jgi:hypothetical protein